MLPSPNRLPKQIVSKVMRSGARSSGDDIAFRYMRSAGAPRFAFIVSTKVDKRATQRNRMRRVMSEAVRTRLARLGGVDGVFIVGKNISTYSQTKVRERVAAHLTQAHLM